MAADDDIEAVAETISQHLTATVRSMKEAQRRGLDDFAAKLAEANAARVEGLAKVEELQKEAARVVAESIDLQRQVEQQFGEALRALSADLAALRPMPLGAKGRIHALSGGRS